MTSFQPLPNMGERYAVQALIGRGGMGQVYLAEDAKHARRVAVKVLDPPLTNALSTTRFLREVSITAKLAHPHIVPLYDSGEIDGTLYYVMPFVEGRSLRDRIRQEGQMPLELALRWVSELADGLSYAHAAGFIHRDIKPENILIQADHALIADFGIARAIDLAGGEGVTTQGAALGTPAYMSPEQSYGDRAVDARTDLYSLACVLYEMLAGDPAFPGNSAQSIGARKMAGQYTPLTVVRPRLPKRIDNAIKRALSPAPGDRFRDVAEFVRVLNQPEIIRPYRKVVVAAVVIAASVALALITSQPEPDRLLANRVVVDVFENRSGDARHDALGIMAADWITSGLQRTGVVEAVPTATTLAASRFARGEGTTDPVNALASETGARFVVTGGIYRDGDSLTFQSQVIDARRGEVIGSMTPVRASAASPGEGLSVLRARLMGLLALRMDERIGSAAAPTDAAPTYAAYSEFSEGLEAYVSNEYERALGFFRRAFNLDTTFVLPLLYASICHTNMGEYAVADSVLGLVASKRHQLQEYDRYWLDYSQAELRGASGLALAAIREAARLAPGSKATYNFAVEALENRQPAAAESALLRLPPDRGPMRGWTPYWIILGASLHAQGKFAEELEAAGRTRLQYPDRLEAAFVEVRALGALGRLNELNASLAAALRRAPERFTEMGRLTLEGASELWAHGDSLASVPLLARSESLYQRSAALDSVEGHSGLLQVAVRQGRWVDAVARAEELTRRYPDRLEFRGALGLALARTGAVTQARSHMETLATDDRRYTFGLPQLEAARIAAALPDSQRAVALIEAAFARGLAYDLEPHRDHALGSLRQHPLLAPVDSRRRR